MQPMSNTRFQKCSSHFRGLHQHQLVRELSQTSKKKNQKLPWRLGTKQWSYDIRQRKISEILATFCLSMAFRGYKQQFKNWINWEILWAGFVKFTTSKARNRTTPLSFPHSLTPSLHPFYLRILRTLPSLATNLSLNSWSSWSTKTHHS